MYKHGLAQRGYLDMMNGFAQRGYLDMMYGIANFSNLQ